MKTKKVTLQRTDWGAYQLSNGERTVYIGVLRYPGENNAEAGWISEHWQTALADDVDLPSPLSRFEPQALYEYAAHHLSGYTVALFDRRSGQWICGSVDDDGNFSRLAPPVVCASRAAAIAEIPAQHAKFSYRLVYDDANEDALRGADIFKITSAAQRIRIELPPKCGRGDCALAPGHAGECARVTRAGVVTGGEL